MTDLLPCPFCGGEANSASYYNKYLIECDDCKEYGHGAYVVARTETEAIAAWNTRVDVERGALPMTEENMAKHGWVRERTCAQEERGWGTEGDHARVWLTCGHDCMVPTVQDLPNYCPVCGARVKEVSHELAL